MVWHVKSLKQALLPITWLNCIFCMGVFEIPMNHPRYVLSIVYVVLMSAGYCAVLYHGIVVMNQMFDYEMVLFYFVAIVNITVAVCSIILFWCKSQNIHKLLKRVSNADDTLEALGVKKNYNKIFNNILSCISIWTASMILLNAMHVVWIWDEVGYLLTLYHTLCFGFPITINSVVDLTFASFVRANVPDAHCKCQDELILRHNSRFNNWNRSKVQELLLSAICVNRCLTVKFQYTNTLMNDVVLCANEESVLKIRSSRNKTPIAIVRANYKNNKDMTKHLIQTLRQLHLELTQIGYQINHSFCLQLLLEMAVHFTIVTAVCFCLYATLCKTTAYEVGGGKIIAMMTWGFVYSLKIIIVNNLCTCASSEAYKAGEIVQTFEESFLDDELREEIRQFTEQIILNSLNFSAAGFFKINNALTGAFFATVTTYVVILIQIRVPGL